MSQSEQFSAVTLEQSEYRMIESLQVENFRCFKSLELHGLRRANIVVGSSASGKTALLEAIKLGLAAVPNVITFLNQLRGFQVLLFPNPSPEQFRSYFSDLFHNFDESSAIWISAVNSNDRTASVRVYFDPKHAVTSQQQVGFQPPATAGAVGTGITATTIIPLAFDRVAFSGERSSLYATVQNGQVLLQPGPELGTVSGFFSSGYSSNPSENASWLSKLSIEKRSDEILDSVKKHFPFVRSLSSETYLPGVSAVYADLPSLPKKLPSSFVSWGFNRLLTFIIAVSVFKGGVVLIDEVENGIYHDQLEEVWRTLFRLAKEHDTQLFVSTHSKECLRAALPTVKEFEDDFTLLRTERVNGSCGITTIDGKMFENALEQGFDVR